MAVYEGNREVNRTDKQILKVWDTDWLCGLLIKQKPDANLGSQIISHIIY